MSLPPHMQEPPVKMAQDAWEKHFGECLTCQKAASIRNACVEGQQLHEEWVVMAHKALKATQP